MKPFQNIRKYNPTSPTADERGYELVKKNTKLLITGGAGFLGTNISILAKKIGYDVIVMDNFVRKGSDKNARILEKKYGVTVKHGDVRLQEDWNLKDIDAVIHLAGQPGIPGSIENPLYDYHTNALGTLNGLEFAKNNGGIPFVYASTNKIYSDAVNELPLKESEKRYDYTDRVGIDESFPMDSSGAHPHSPYGVSKASGDLLTQEYYHAFEVPTVVMRMSCIYGLYQNGVSEQGWTDYFVRQRVLGDNTLTFFGNGKQVRDCLFGEDAARAYLIALEKIDIAKGKVYNLGGGTFNCSLIEWVDILNGYRGSEPMKITYEDWRLADHRIYVSDTTKITKELGWMPEVEIVNGIHRMVHAYKTNFYEN